MQEIGMTKLANEVKNFVAERLESGEWNFAVFYQDELVWSNDEKRVWCRLFKDYKFKTKHQWKKKAMAFEISLSPEQDCWVDEIQVSVVREEEIIYPAGIANLDAKNLVFGINKLCLLFPETLDALIIAEIQFFSR